MDGAFVLLPPHGGGHVPSWQFLLNLEDKLLEFPFASMRFLASALEISKQTVKTYLTEYLHYKKFNYKWIPHTLTDENKKQRVLCAKQMLDVLTVDQINGFHHIITGDETWLPVYQPANYMWLPESSTPPTQPKLNPLKDKVMLTVFWGVEGFFLLKVLPKGRTINGAYFREEIILPLSKEMKSKSMVPKLWLHMDNASPHKAGDTLDLITRLGFIQMPQPPFSPDLAPSDFYLFGRVKKEMKGKKYETPEEAVKAFEKILDGIQIQERLDVMVNWMERLKSVIISGGEYC
jgi:transposase